MTISVNDLKSRAITLKKIIDPNIYNYLLLIIGDLEQIAQNTNNPAENFIFVSSKEDFPTPVNGVITLEDNYTYFITTTVDLEGDRLVCGENTTIIGGSSENCRLKSTGLVNPLISSEYSLPLRNISIEANQALGLDAANNPTSALDWFGVNFVNCPDIGGIANYSNFIAQDCGFLNSSGLVFSGTMGTIGFSQCIFDSSGPDSNLISISASATVTRRFRIIYSAFVVLSGETGISVSEDANIPVEGYILDTVNFSGGGTYTTGVAYSDNRAFFLNNRGVPNSAEIANYYMNNNAVATDIISQGTPVKVAGNTTANTITQKFTLTDNRATYSGAIIRDFKVTATLSVEASGSGKVVGVYVYKSGQLVSESETYATTGTNNRAENVTCQTILNLSQNDYIEIWIENDTDTGDLTVTDMNVIVEALN